MLEDCSAWTSWSEWSSCNSTCHVIGAEKPMRNRTRQCTPERLCKCENPKEMPRQQFMTCHNLPACPAPYKGQDHCLKQTSPVRMINVFSMIIFSHKTIFYRIPSLGLSVLAWIPNPGLTNALAQLSPVMLY